MVTDTKVSAPNLRRGLSVLEFLATQQPSATVPELSERLGYPIASLYRIANVLTSMGYISQDSGTKRYTLTNKMLRFGQPQSSQRGLVEAALPAARGLWKATGETTQICCLAGVEATVLEQFVSVHPFKYSTDVGARAPIHSCAPGKAMLAWLDDEHQNELLATLKFSRFTSTTITSVRRMKAELGVIRKQGFSIDDAEGLEGIHCVAAAILNTNGSAVGAITIAAPATRLTQKMFAETGKQVAAAAAAASSAYAA